MNLHSLRYFIEVAKTKSFTEASKNLFVSQPGISQQIFLLEKQLGISLLNRTTRKVELTEEGRYLFDQTLTSFAEIENTVATLIETTTFPKLINVATIPSAASLYLPTVLKTLHLDFPDTEFKIKETTSSDVMNLIHERTYHLGFIRTTTRESLSEKGIGFLEFERYPIKAVISSQHKLANRTSIKLKELENDFFLHYDQTESKALYDLLESACKQVGFTPDTICSGSELLTIANIIAGNLAVTLLPEDMLNLVSSDQIRAVDLEDVQAESSIVAVWGDREYVNVNTKLLIDILKNMKIAEPIP